MRIVFLFFMVLNLAFAQIDQHQLKVLNIVYKICSKYHANDGFSFENTCAAIALTESDAGKMLIGDQGSHPEILVNSSLGVMQVRVRTALEVLKNFPELRKQYIQFWHNDVNAIDKYVPLLKKINYYKLRANQALNNHDIKSYKLWQSRYWKAKQKFKKYFKAYRKDLHIAEMLLADIKFNVKIAVHYLILNYEIAKQRGYWNPWMKSISRYNGGWHNKKYTKKVLSKMRPIRVLKKRKLLGI